MSLKATSWAWEIPTISVGMVNKFVLLALADYADKDGVCWPSQATLGDKTALCERSVRKALAWLEENGYITRECRSSTSGRRSDVISLVMDIPCNRHQIPVAQPASEGPATGTTVPVATSVVESVSKNSKEEELYSAYPRRVGKLNALKAIRKALTLTTFDDLLMKVKKFADSSKEADIQFIPYPATWFNQGRWMDELKSERKAITLNASQTTSNLDIFGRNL